MAERRPKWQQCWSQEKIGCKGVLSRERSRTWACVRMKLVSSRPWRRTALAGTIERKVRDHGKWWREARLFGVDSILSAGLTQKQSACPRSLLPFTSIETTSLMGFLACEKANNLSSTAWIIKLAMSENYWKTDRQNKIIRISSVLREQTSQLDTQLGKYTPFPRFWL